MNNETPMSDVYAAFPGLIPEALDLRRAAAIIKHANPDRMDLAGLGEIVAEVKGDRRVSQMLAAVAVIAYQVPAGVKLDSQLGQSGLDALIAKYAAQHEMKGRNE